MKVKFDIDITVINSIGTVLHCKGSSNCCHSTVFVERMQDFINNLFELSSEELDHKISSL